jgi:hypothetical protein
VDIVVSSIFWGSDLDHLFFVAWHFADSLASKFYLVEKKEPGSEHLTAWSRAYTWRRPTLTRPIVSLPLALRRFTSGFGMGPGGSTALWSPEVNPVQSGLGLWGSERVGFVSF